MRNRIERLRFYLLAGALVLVAVVAAFIGSARYIRRHALSRIASKLGVDIKSETNGFTYSQSVQGRTIYTIHAAKEIEHRDGKISLHDVSMILYGRTGDRADMVYGKEFEYDQAGGVLRAVGLVHIDLGAAGSGKAGARPLKPLTEGEDDPAGNPRVLHATTSGLVYLDKLGVAATSEPIEFQTAQIKGRAVGADYSTDNGMLLLHANVTMSGMAGARAIAITAATAQLDQRNRRALLTHAHYTSMGQTMDAAEATLHARPDNSLDRIEARGDVTLNTRGVTVAAARADTELGDRNKLQNVVLSGGVHYAQDLPLRESRGESSDAQITFFPDGASRHAVFSGDVHMLERTRPQSNSGQPWSVRELFADTVTTEMAEAGEGRSELRDADARGHARLSAVDNAAKTAVHTPFSSLAGDDIKIHFLAPAAATRSPRVDTVIVRGHAALHQITAGGIEQNTESDNLDARFRQSTGAAAGKVAATSPNSLGDQLASAVQEGHVRLTRSTPAKAGAPASTPDVETATAQRAAFDGAANQVDLGGGVRLSNATSLLLAAHVVLDRDSGDAEADGDVKVSYLQPPSTTTPQTRPGEPLHVLAERAQLDHAADSATFFGKPVRAWQGASQIQAPVLEISRPQRRLVARGSGTGSTLPVHARLAATPGPSANGTPAALRKPAAPPNPAKSPSSSSPGGPIQIDSGMLIYSDLARQAEFSGGVHIANANETISAQTATAFLQPAPPASQTPSASAAEKPSNSQPPSLGGNIDRVVATGAILVDQPGMHASGARLLYTAADSLVVLTGTPGAPPRVLDTARGSSVTAPAFRFHTTDQSVEALSTAPGESPGSQRVLADTPVHH